MDCCIDLAGYISDQTITVDVGKEAPALHKRNVVTKECLELGIAAAKPGGRLLEIGAAVEKHAKAAGYGVVTDYSGHGVGLEMHEDPSVPNVPHGSNPRLRPGMVIAIEPMINMGTGEVAVLEDDWTVVTRDRKPSCHWEKTVAILESGVEVLSA
jgi:methionyl aminopeptidase